MSQILKRPQLHVKPASGLMRNEHFQIAYATNDIDKACDIFGSRYGIKSFKRLEGTLPAGGSIRIELAWVGTLMVELLTANGAGSDIYKYGLPAGSDFAMRHHHLGYLIHDKQEWDGLDIDAERTGAKILYRNEATGFIDSLFVAAPELGHLLEYVFPEQAGIDFFEAVPGN